MNEKSFTQSLKNQRRKVRADRTARLSDVLDQFMARRVEPQHKKFAKIPNVWNELLPAELARHCKLDEIADGCLKVLVDSSAYLYELRLCSSELLSQLQYRCPSARLRKIRFAIV